jgi:hypothetical protein
MQRTENIEQKAKSKEQRAESREQRAESREQRANRRNRASTYHFKTSYNIICENLQKKTTKMDQKTTADIFMSTV